MRTIKFDDPKSYELCYEGLVTTSTKGIETRLLAKVLTKLEKIGTPLGDKGLYTLAEWEALELEDAEYIFVKKSLNEVQWNGIGAKNAAKLLDLVDNAVES